MKISAVKVRLRSLTLGYSSLLLITAMISTLFSLAAPAVYAKPYCEGEDPPPICDGGRPEPEPSPAPTPVPTPPPTPVRVRIELLEVRCGNTEDVTGEDEFYILGALSDGTNTKGVLTSPFGINDGQIKPFRSEQQVLFDAIVPAGQTVRGGLKAFDEDFAKDWANYASDVNQLTWLVASNLVASGNPYAMGAGTILGLAVGAFDAFASLDKDDDLGTIELNVPASGSSVEEKEWRFSEEGDIFGYSSWDYTVRYRIIRG